MNTKTYWEDLAILSLEHIMGSCDIIKLQEYISENFKPLLLVLNFINKNGLVGSKLQNTALIRKVIINFAQAYRTGGHKDDEDLKAFLAKYTELQTLLELILKSNRYYEMEEEINSLHSATPKKKLESSDCKSFGEFIKKQKDNIQFRIDEATRLIFSDNKYEEIKEIYDIENEQIDLRKIGKSRALSKKKLEDLDKIIGLRAGYREKNPMGYTHDRPPTWEKTGIKNVAEGHEKENKFMSCIKLAISILVFCMYLATIVTLIGQCLNIWGGMWGKLEITFQFLAVSFAFCGPVFSTLDWFNARKLVKNFKPKEEEGRNYYLRLLKELVPLILLVIGLISVAGEFISLYNLIKITTVQDAEPLLQNLLHPEIICNSLTLAALSIQVLGLIVNLTVQTLFFLESSRNLSNAKERQRVLHLLDNPKALSVADVPITKEELEGFSKNIKQEVEEQQEQHNTIIRQIFMTLMMLSCSILIQELICSQGIVILGWIGIMVAGGFDVRDNCKSIQDAGAQPALSNPMFGVY